MKYGEILSCLLRENHLKLNGLAVRTGLSSGLLSAYARNEKVPNLKNALIIADYFGVSLDYMMGRTEIREVASVQPTPVEIKKDPPPEMSRNESDMLQIFRRLTDREQILLMGQANGLILAHTIQAEEAVNPPASQVG